MSISKHLLERTREWLRKADHDLTFLFNAPFNVEDPPTDTVGRLSHMVGEYSLKAFLVFHKKRIPHIHELRDLLTRCIEIDNHFDLDDLRQICSKLTSYKVELTYPTDPPIVISIDEAKEAITMAKQLRNFVELRLSAFGFTSTSSRSQTC